MPNKHLLFTTEGCSELSMYEEANLMKPLKCRTKINLLSPSLTTNGNHLHDLIISMAFGWAGSPDFASQDRAKVILTSRLENPEDTTIEGPIQRLNFVKNFFQHVEDILIRVPREQALSHEEEPAKREGQTLD